MVKSKELVQFAYAFMVRRTAYLQTLALSQAAINKSTYKAHSKARTAASILFVFGSIDPLCVW